MDRPSTAPGAPRVPSLSEGVDPTTFSVMLHALGDAASTVTRVLQQGARSTIISIARDHSASIFTSDGRMLFQNDALPIHTVGGHLSIEAVMEDFGDDIHEGDIFMVNDPFRGAPHNSDLTVIMPVFFRGERVFWTSIRAHQNNTGEAAFGYASTSVWQDGIQIPPVRIFERGREIASIVALYLRNVRLPEWLEADLRAMVGAVRAGEARLLELLEAYGGATVLATTREMIEYSDRRTAAEIRAMPDGVYESEGWVDSDGRGTFNVRIACRVTIAGDMVHVDYSDSDPQVGGHINCSRCVLLAAGSIPVLTVIDPSIPKNEGCMRHIRVYGEEGRVVNASWPASTWWCTTTPGDVLIETGWKALAQAVPERATAGWGRCQQRLSMGEDRRAEPPETYAASLFVALSAGGAVKGHDGWPLTQCAACLGIVEVEAVEMVELLHPIMIESNEFAIDSAGAGEWIGGHGCETVIRPEGGTLYMKFEFEGTLNPPFGLFGGLPGNGGCKYKIDRDGRRIFYMAHPDPELFVEGERYVTVTTGGGGWGHPADRPVESVVELVRGGYVSAQAARERYGVTFRAGTLEVDRETTARLRAGMRAAADTTVWRPTAPGAGGFWKTRFREGDAIVTETMPRELQLGLTAKAR